MPGAMKGRDIRIGVTGLVIGLLVMAIWNLMSSRRTTLQTAPATRAGPMVGHVSATSAAIWAYGGPGARWQITWWRAGDAAGEADTMPVDSPASNHHVARAGLTGLEPGTTYRYAMMLDGQSDPRLEGQFTTAPLPGQPARFKLAVASCMHSLKSHASFCLLNAQRPQFMLLLGDQVYSDTTDPQKIWHAHLRSRARPEFAAVIRNVPTYATWDDHDFVGNGSDGTAKGKDRALAAFKQLWANPYAGTDTVPGVFYRFGWGDVDLFVLDARYHRSPNKAPNDDRKRMLGDDQFEWLVEGLLASRARFKIIVQGSALTLDEADGWLTFDFARRRIFRTIAQNGIEGVLWLSGDLHRSLVEVHSRCDTGFYDLYEIISSGIANSRDLSFATLQFDTTLPDPTVRVQIIHGDATVHHDQTIKLSQLKNEAPTR